MALGGRPRYIVPATLDLCDFLELQAKFGKVDLQVEFTVSERLSTICSRAPNCACERHTHRMRSQAKR